MYLNKAAYVDKSARIFGDVSIGRGSSVWPHACMRSEIHAIEIGEYTNIQDFVMLHVGVLEGISIGDYTSICHRATIHGARIGSHCLVGINAVVMDGCEIGDCSVIGGMCYLKEGTIIPKNSIVVGIPGRVLSVRDNSAENRKNAEAYHRMALGYAKGCYRYEDTLDAENPGETVSY